MHLNDVHRAEEAQRAVHPPMATQPQHRRRVDHRR